MLYIPRDPGSPKLRMVSWNLNTLRFGGDYIPQSSSDKVMGYKEQFFFLMEIGHIEKVLHKFGVGRDKTTGLDVCTS